MLVAELPLVQVPFTQVLWVVGVAALALIVLNALFVFTTHRKAGICPSRPIFCRVLYLAYLATVIVLAVSSFGTIVQYGHMSGYALLAHVAAAGAFVFLLLGIALLYLPRGVSSAERELPADNRWWLARWSAWTLVVGSLAAAGTMFLSMLPILDTEGLVEVAALHRYAGLIVVVAAAFHFYALLCTKLGLR